MVDMKMGPTPTFFPPYTVDYHHHHHYHNGTSSTTTAPSSAMTQNLHSASVGDLSRYLNSTATAAPTTEVGAYWPDFSSSATARCDAYYLGGGEAAAVTPTRGILMGNGGMAGGAAAPPRSSQPSPPHSSHSHSHSVSHSHSHQSQSQSQSQQSQSQTHTHTHQTQTHSPPAALHSPSPASSRTLTTSPQRTNRSARTATHASPSTANVGAGDVVPTSTSSNARGAQFTIIANVPYDTVRQDLVSEFRKFGRVELAMVVCDEASRHPHKEWTSTAGYAFVRFSKRSEAAAAIQAATMGLITIRGTRVRADWARKDSYAKRGRVSPAQGAPSLNPHGIPDGITLLQDSLNRAAARNQWSMYGDISSYVGINDSSASSTSKPHNQTADNWTSSAKATDVQSPSSTNEQVFQVLEDVIVQALELIGPQKQSSPSAVYQNKSSNNDNHLLPSRRNNEQPLTLPTHNNISSCDSSSFCNRLPIVGVAQRPNYQEGGTPQAAGDEDTTASSSAGVIPAVSAQELASALSPASRGLLTVALSDVAARDAFTDVSPMAHQPATNHARRHFNSPEELLHQTMQNLSAAEAPASAVTTTRKAGPSAPGGALGASTASDFSSLSEIEDIACSEGSLTPPL